MASLVAPSLDTFLGKPIKDICTVGYDDGAQNHCAHFVSHALEIKNGILCGDMKFDTRHQGTTIKVHELFNSLSQRGPWEESPKGASSLLVFVTSAKNVSNNRMSNVPQKHVGIYLNGGVYNYSNTRHQVVLDASLDIFHDKFKKTYHGKDISLYYGVIA
ncbi:MAG TPA: hypothetical protein VKZ53_20820 [Candidatus Angelobacter sp.]|nr:hypothetical protein [Candidatus Angelobacter sp.]